MKSIVVLLFVCFSSFVRGQEQGVTWLTFEELEEALVQAPKKVMIHFYADWCVYCEKMERDVYTKPAVEAVLASDYYAVKFNVESKDTIQFGGKKFINSNVGNRRNPYHQLAELLAARAQSKMVLPAILFFDVDFNLSRSVFRYIPPKELVQLLQE